MTTRYEIRLSPNLKHLDIYIQGAPTSLGCEARVPVREGREPYCWEFAEHLVNLLNADVIEQARKANGAAALRQFARRAGWQTLEPEQEGTHSVPYDPALCRPDEAEARWQQA